SVALQAPGFSIADRGDAGGKFQQTTIRYASGAFAKAQLLQRYLQNGARLVSDPTLRTVDVALVVGSDYAGVRSTPSPVPPSTTPTTGGSTTPTTIQPSC
ncbi:MAG: LytR C-terminal domain-containing protein, partial [Acidimicrobiia bacterium]|nr:LytR C-terminal domain-containing protein [Acidimicrobiia bacterium]